MGSETASQERIKNYLPEPESEDKNEEGELDYDLLAGRIMSKFGYSIEYTLSRTYPAFMYLNRLIDRVRADETIDGFFAGYTAGKYGGKIADRLFEKRGSFHINKKTKTNITKKDIDRAIKKAQKIAKQQARKYKKNV